MLARAREMMTALKQQKKEKKGNSLRGFWCSRCLESSPSAWSRDPLAFSSVSSVFLGAMKKEKAASYPSSPVSERVRPPSPLSARTASPLSPLQELAEELMREDLQKLFPVTDRRLTLDDVLRSTELRSYLVRFAELQHSEESVLCFDEVLKLRATASAHELKNLLVLFNDAYVREGGAMEINIGGALKRRLQSVAKGDEAAVPKVLLQDGLLDEVTVELTRMMQSSLFLGFLRFFEAAVKEKAAQADQRESLKKQHTSEAKVLEEKMQQLAKKPPRRSEEKSPRKTFGLMRRKASTPEPTPWPEPVEKISCHCCMQPVGANMSCKLCKLWTCGACIVVCKCHLCAKNNDCPRREHHGDLKAQ